MYTYKAAKGRKALEDEREHGTPNPDSFSHSSSNVDSSSELKTAALAAPLSADTMSSAAAPWISNPVVVNAFDTTAAGSSDPSGLAFVPGGTPGTGTLLL